MKNKTEIEFPFLCINVCKEKKMNKNLVSYAQKIWCYLFEKEGSFWNDNMRIKK